MGAYYDAPIGYPLSIPCQKSAMSPRSYWAERGLGYGFGFAQLNPCGVDISGGIAFSRRMR